MSRSIHETNKDLAMVVKAGHHGEDAVRVKRLKARLAQKRRIKDLVRGERSHVTAEGLICPVDTLPILVADEAAHIRYPASPEDIRAVMRLLPKGVLDGLSRIELCLGAGYQRFTRAQHNEPDPYTSRYGCETFPGVFTGRALGTYSPSRQRIRVFAYVYESTMVDRGTWELYLRFRMLATFIHEAAHHHDHAMRVARGRWIADDRTKVEMYAEKFEQEWVLQYVVPYLEETYPAECQALASWLTHHGGIALPLSFWSREARTTRKRSRVTIQGGVFSAEGALASLRREVVQDKPNIETRLGFAKELHWAEYYEEALEIIERVLQEHPANLSAFVLRADILIHQRRYDSALSVLQQVLCSDRDNLEALLLLADLHAARQDWKSLARVTTRLLDEINVSTFTRESELLLQRARARMELRDFLGAKEDLLWLQGEPRKWIQRQAAWLRKQIELRQRRKSQEGTSTRRQPS